MDIAILYERLVCIVNFIFKQLVPWSTYFVHLNCLRMLIFFLALFARSLDTKIKFQSDNLSPKLFIYFICLNYRIRGIHLNKPEKSICYLLAADGRKA